MVRDPGDHLCSLRAASEAGKKVFSPGGAGHILLQKLICFPDRFKTAITWILRPIPRPELVEAMGTTRQNTATRPPASIRPLEAVEEEIYRGGRINSLLLTRPPLYISSSPASRGLIEAGGLVAVFYRVVPTTSASSGLGIGLKIHVIVVLNLSGK